MKTATLVAWALTLLPLCVIGVHRLVLVIARLRMGRVAPTEAPRPIEAQDTPSVTIQLPLYNERRVARRIIEGRPYRSVDDLTQVKGIGERILGEIRLLVIVMRRE